MSSPIWGPFDSAPEAAGNLSKFTDTVLDPSVGITWLASGTLYALRPPRYDVDGYGQIITFEMRPFPSVPAPPPRGTGQRVKAWFWDGVSKAQALGKRAVSEGRALDSWVASAYRKAIGKDRDDTIGLGIDVAAVVVSAGLFCLGPVEILGTVAAGAGALLLILDGIALLTELAGHDEAAEKFKDETFPVRCVAILATLPDAAWNVGKVLAEGRHMAAEAARITHTVDSAAANASRSSAVAAASTDPLAVSRAAMRARKYADIGERARRRAVATQQKLAAFYSLNTASRLLLVPSAALLAKEVNDDSEDDRRGRLQAWLSRYVFHTVSVHRETRT